MLLMFFYIFTTSVVNAQELKLNDKGYFVDKGVNVMAFDDIYPEGHQGGVSIIMNGKRLATNGDIRLEQTPGQWQPLPKQNRRVADVQSNTITAYMSYPDSSKHLTGFNPMIYPDYNVNYVVTVTGVGRDIIVTVDLDNPVPASLLGKVGFNLELFPGELFGKPWIMDNESGIFPRQANGPALILSANTSHPGNYLLQQNITNPGKEANANDLMGINGALKYGNGYSPIVADDVIAAPYAVGHSFTVRPDDPYSMFTIKSDDELKLFDGRFNHNNGWFVLRTDVPAGKTKGAIRWVITPNVVEDWIYSPVIQISQVGYKPFQPKSAVIELDSRDTSRPFAELVQITSDGEKVVLREKPTEWGGFLRYNYVKFDFSNISDEGIYKVRYGKNESDMFRIANNVYQRGVWQPILEYYLPIQMCHMRVMDKYRVWHDDCHEDDGQMAPTDYNHIDGYTQGTETLTHYHSGDNIPGVNIGGWHDAGDYDLRVESQSTTVYDLVMAWEQFGVDYDVTSINQDTRICEIHQPDGKNDILQQIEHGTLSVVGGYKALGRLYRGIICRNLRQYVLLGDPGAMTDGIRGNDDDRWVFTQDNPSAAFSVAGKMAAASRALKGFNDELSADALAMCEDLYENTPSNNSTLNAKIQAAVELYLTTGNDKYKKFLLDNKDAIVKSVASTGWYTCRIIDKIGNKKLQNDFREAVAQYGKSLESQSAETPYGVPYRPSIWGAGWDIQNFGYHAWFLAKAYPDLISNEYVFNALNFVLGCHPGLNPQSFAAGVGTNSALIGYGLNRADWSYIPGAVASGTALIRPDFPELLEFPYLWQQMENCIPDAPDYMFLVLAADELSGK